MNICDKIKAKLCGEPKIEASAPSAVTESSVRKHRIEISEEKFKEYLMRYLVFVGAAEPSSKDFEIFYPSYMFPLDAETITLSWKTEPTEKRYPLGGDPRNA